VGVPSPSRAGPSHMDFVLLCPRAAIPPRLRGGCRPPEVGLARLRQYMNGRSRKHPTSAGGGWGDLFCREMSDGRMSRDPTRRASARHPPLKKGRDSESSARGDDNPYATALPLQGGSSVRTTASTAAEFDPGRARKREPLPDVVVDECGEDIRRIGLWLGALVG
jgi:hypothetical protein